MEILTNCKNTNTEDHDGSGHQRQPAGWLAPPGFATRQSAVKTAQNQVQTKQKNTKTIVRNIGTYNVQGLLSKTKQMLIADDFFQYKMSALMLQETHLKGHGAIDIKSSKGKTVRLYYSGHSKKSSNGVGILVDPKTECDYTPISSRLMLLKIENGNTPINLISAYGPTSKKTEENPEATIQFYNDLSGIINKIKEKEVVIIGGDFNAKVKDKNISGNNRSKTVGKYAKSKINENGEILLEFAELQNLRLTNTFFKHKPAHMTTWQCPERTSQVIDSASGQPRKNPYRNQIDFILTRNSNNIEVFNSRSYGGFSCNSDHKPVIAQIKVAWKYKKRQQSSTTKKTLNVQALNQNSQTKLQYQTLVAENLAKCKKPKNIQERWNNIIESTKSAAIETVGYKSRKHITNNKKVQNLSDNQKKLLKEINSTNCRIKKADLKRKRNKVMREIHKAIKEEKNKKLTDIMAPIEKRTNQPDQMYKAIKQLKRMKPKSNLLIKTEKGFTANQTKQIELITKYFKQQFFKNAEQMPYISPKKMQVPFTSKEIKNAASKMKNGTSPSPLDDVHTEMIKYGPPEVFDETANIFNEIANTGNHPKELIQGIIAPLQKPGKQKGPIENLRPITLLSVLRKLLAICLCERTNERIDKHIPIQQAAYRTGRSTTEHVFATKLVIQRTIASKHEKVHLLLLDMSKAFDTIKRKVLITELQEVLDHDEIHLFRKLLQVKLAVKCGSTIGDFFDTDTGGPQGDCSSAKNFTFYLAKTMENNNDEEINLTENEILLEQMYADDISELASNEQYLENKMEQLPKILEEGGLMINHDKTEKYEISRTSDTSWKKCKLLGTLLDTSQDIKRRKGLAIDAAKTLKHVFKGKKVWTSTKSRTFDTYITSIFLYNASTWTLTKTQEAKIDSFQRRMIRINVLNIRWPKKMSNDNVYKISKLEPWSKKIKKQKLTWFGHVMRMNENTPARKALRFAQQNYEKPPGRPKETWIQSTEKLLEDTLNMTWHQAEQATQDRKIWRNLVRESLKSNPS